MNWSEIKRWANEHDYTTKKVADGYYWGRNNDASKSGISKSVSKLAYAIFNDMTDNKWIEHQNSYDPNK